MLKKDFNVKPDMATKIFMERPDIFADAINFAVYNGSQVVTAESLESGSTVATSFVYNGNNAAVTFEKIRDVRKVVRLSSTDQTAYMIYGAENQNHLHYAMPVKNMLYDIMEYADQIDTRGKSMKPKKKSNETGDFNPLSVEKPKVSPDEFLSSWKKDDKLVPVVSVVINFSNEKWDAPLSLHDMFDKAPPERYNIIKELIPDYRILLIDPHQMNDDDFGKFNSKLGIVLDFIKNSTNKQKFAEKFNGNISAELDADSVMVINSCTGSNIPLPEKDEVTNMCEAIKGIRDDAKMENQAEMIEAMKANGASEEFIQATLKTMQENAEKKEMTQP